VACWLWTEREKVTPSDLAKKTKTSTRSLPFAVELQLCFHLILGGEIPTTTITSGLMNKLIAQGEPNELGLIENKFVRQCPSWEVVRIER